MGGRHIHHLFWGILLLLLSGYGVAAALTLDEFALWLNLRDVYWQREGRESLEAMARSAVLPWNLQQERALMSRNIVGRTPSSAPDPPVRQK